MVPRFKGSRRQVRKFLKHQFVLNHMKQCNNCFLNEEFSHSNWKTPQGRDLVNNIRQKVGYSPGTANMDVYWQIYLTWLEVTGRAGKRFIKGKWN